MYNSSRPLIGETHRHTAEEQKEVAQKVMDVIFSPV